MIRRLIALVFVAAIVYAGYHVGTVWVHYRTFQDAVRDTALFGNGKTDDDLKAKIMDEASRNQIPLSSDDVTITRRGGQVVIEARYVQTVTILPGVTRRIDFTAK
jgi:hypothetical protein